MALETGAPGSADTAAVLAANANIATAFGASPTFFAIDELGGGYAKSGGTASETTTDTVSLTVDLTQLASPNDLEVGLFNGTALGSGFTSLTFTLTADGDTASPLISQTFTSAAAAVTYFTDHALDLGSLATGPLAGSTLTLQASFTVTTASAGQGFYAQFMLGDPPSASQSPVNHQQFIQVMAGLGGVPGHSAPAAASDRPINPPVLSLVDRAQFV